MIIALTGPAGCGKSTAAAHLASRHGFARVRFAGPLKAMMRAYLDAVGLGPTVVEAMIEGELKELPSPYLANRSPRHAMQQLGTGWGRDAMGPQLWISAWAEAAARALADGAAGIVAEDCRYENEAQAVRGLGGTILRLDRPGLSPLADRHVSEAGIADAAPLANDGDPALLLRRLDFVVRALARAA